MIVSKQYATVTRVTVSIHREDMAKLLNKAGEEIPEGFTCAESSIDGEWPLIMGFEKRDEPADNGDAGT